jgi:hypothetical protein
MLCIPFATDQFSERVFFVAVRKSFLICFHGFVEFLNPGVLRLGFSGCGCGGLAWASWARNLRLCDCASRAAERDWASKETPERAIGRAAGWNRLFRW